VAAVVESSRARGSRADRARRRLTFLARTFELFDPRGANRRGSSFGPSGTGAWAPGTDLAGARPLVLASPLVGTPPAGPGAGGQRSRRNLRASALLLLLAAEDVGWRRILDHSDTLGSSEWMPFFVEKARRQLERGAPAEAEAALAEMPRFDLEQCEVLLVRRDVARARERSVELAGLEAAWPRAFPKTLSVPAWPASGAGTLSLCVDPEADGASDLVVTLGASEPALAWWGWDGCREGVSARGGRAGDLPARRPPRRALVHARAAPRRRAQPDVGADSSERAH
jgi:hypothetical protein